MTRQSKTVPGANFRSPFPPLDLSVEDEAQLESVAQLFVHNAIAQYQRYEVHDKRAIDRDVWKFAKRKENIRMYVERREKDIRKRQRRRALRNREFQAHHPDAVTVVGTRGGAAAPSSTAASTNNTTTNSSNLYPDTESTVASCSPMSGASHLSQQRHFAPKARSTIDLPVVMVVGTMEGTVQDVMLGAVNTTVDAMRIKTAYVDDTFVGGAVLATIVTPTPSDPFRSLSIKWIEKGQPLHLDKFVKKRDSVLLEATGITRLANGEAIGYVLMHTVHFPQTQPLPSNIRGNMSVCVLVRQISPTSVDVFLKCYVSPATSGLMRAIIVKSTVQGVYSVWKYVHCGRMKKLAWALSQQHKCPIEQIQDNDSRHSSHATGSSCCVTCQTRARRRRFFFPSRGNRGSTSHGATCKLCFQYVCASCAIKKQLGYVTVDGELQQNEVTLCALCIHAAMIETDTLAVASEQIAAAMPAMPLMKSFFTVSSMAVSDKSLFEHAAPW
ncbi:hypothetical protein Gpo141_00013023 [Globisporangium polare]